MSRWTRRGSRSAAVAALACVPLALLGPAASAHTFAPLTWTAPALVEHAPFASGHAVTAVSCLGRLCVVGDNAGNILTSTNPAGTTDTWKAAAISPGHSIEFLGCAAAGFCVALAAVKGRAPLIFTSVNPTGGRHAWILANARLLIRAISCPSTKLCVAVGKGAITTSTNPTAGQHSVWKVTTLGPQLSSTHITGVSCPRPTFCVAGDDKGNVYTSKNPTGGKSAWTVTLVTTAAIKPVTCPSASFCAALDDGGLLYSTNPAGGVSAWHEVFSMPPVAKGLSCVSATFCTVVANDKNNFNLAEPFITTDPTSSAAVWLPIDTIDITRNGGVTTVTCASTHLCVAGDLRGDVVSSPNSTGGSQAWTTVNITGVSGIVSLDCPTAALCVAGDDAGNIITSTRPGGGASAWHSAVVEGPPSFNGIFAKFTAVSCPTTKLCVVADNHGNVLWSTNPTGGASAWSKASIDKLPEGFAIHSLACPTTSLCIAGDSLGDLLTSTNPTGGTSAWQVAGLGLDRQLYVTCPTASLCLASSNGTIFNSTNPAGGASTWHASAFFGEGGGPGPITCPTITLCVGLGAGTIFSSRQPTGGILDWNHVSVTPAAGRGGTVSCPSARFCLAEFEFGPGPNVFASSDPASTNASAWQKAGVTAAAVSCLSLSLCVAGTGLGQVQVGTPRAQTSTSLKLSAKRIAYGHEQGERLTVTVRPRLAGVTAGTVVISARAKTICTLRHLSHGTASCTLTRKQLRPGAYRLIARYSGSKTFLGSKSPAKVLTVFRPR